MNRYLLAVSIGPVQPFIAAARRMRDLWFGSLLLSEISRAVAKAIDREACELIYPAETDLGNIANIVLAVLPHDSSPAEVAKKAHDACQMRWRNEADRVFSKVKPIVRQSTWEKQIDDVIEFYAAWVPLDNQDDYKKARARVMRILSGRKACRDFLPAQGEYGVPKSSLDGARETVLIDEIHGLDIAELIKKLESKGLNRSIAYMLRLSPGEQLDAVGLVKRLGGDNVSFPSLARIAVDPWVRAIERVAQRSRKAARIFSELKSLCEEIVTKGILGRVKQRQYQAFPFEGALLYRSRLRALEQEGMDKETIDRISKLVQELEKIEIESGHPIGDPTPYLAVLRADGDRKVLSNIASPEEHREFSVALACFAKSGDEIVQENCGATIFAGGDDILAFLPLDKCLDCAQKLHDEFAGKMKEALRAGAAPTLSVGIAICHFMDPLENLLHYALEAERDAKEPDRDGIAIHLHPRSGAPIKIRSRWKDNMLLRVKGAIGALKSGLISNKFAYDLHELALVYSDWETEKFKEAVSADTQRLIRRKDAERELPEWLEQAISNITSSDKLELIAKEILIARRIERAHYATNESMEVGT